MRVLFYSFEPFAIGRGAKQAQITRTRDALRQLNVDVEFLRWYDGNQSGDVLHFFGRITTDLLGLARACGMKVVVSDWLGEQAARSPIRLTLERWMIRTFGKILPGGFTQIFNWGSYQLADACVATSQSEANLLSYVFGVPPEKVHIVPTDVARESRRATPDAWMAVGRQLKHLYQELLGDQ